MDFSGKGFIEEENFLQSYVITKVPFSSDDIIFFLRHFNLFPLHGGNRQQQTNSGKPPKRGVMIFDTFKKTFFPYLHQTFNITEIMQQNEEQDDNKITNRILKEPEYVKDRLRTLDDFLKGKFSRAWASVRKGFLDLDLDHDGFISVEDIMKYFGAENELNFNDLKKLLQEKDSNKKGFLNYQDFSKWVANSIHMMQGFYFRHDSIKNPVFEKNLASQKSKYGRFKEKISNDMIKDEDVTRTLLDKIRFQWKTIRKSFHDFSKDKSGGIEVSELKFYLNHWGMNVTEEQLQRLYSELDWDKDGLISYADFQKTVGCEIHPGEKLYFRQDQPKMLKINTCKYQKCWQPTKQGKFFCNLHQKMNQNIANEVLMKIYEKIAKKWRKFMSEIDKLAENQEHTEIKFDIFKKVLKRYGVIMTEADKELLLDTYPGSDEGERNLINIQKLQEMRQQHAASQTYKKIEFNDSENEEQPVDKSGFTGDFYRKKEKLESMDQIQFFKIISEDEKAFAEVMRIIKYIDKDHNGYITTTEMDDILKMNYPSLQGKDIFQPIKKYRSIQNKILVDYKLFRNDVASRMKIFQVKDNKWLTLSFGQKQQMYSTQTQLIHHSSIQETKSISESPIFNPRHIVARVQTKREDGDLEQSKLKSQPFYNDLLSPNINQLSTLETHKTMTDLKRYRPRLNYSTLNMPTISADISKQGYVSTQASANNMLDQNKSASISRLQTNNHVKGMSRTSLRTMIQSIAQSRAPTKALNSIQNNRDYNTQSTILQQNDSEIQINQGRTLQNFMKKRNRGTLLSFQPEIPDKKTIIKSIFIERQQPHKVLINSSVIENPESKPSDKKEKKQLSQHNLTEQIKEFRKNIKDVKNIPSKSEQTKRMEKSVEHFRTTLKSFGLDLSDQVLDKIIYDK